MASALGARIGWFFRVGAMSEDLLAAWVVEERAELVLDGEYRPLLAKLIERGEIPHGMISRLGVTRPPKEDRAAFWAEALDEMIKMATESPSKLKRRCILTWLAEPTALFRDASGDVTEGREDMDEREGPPDSPAYREFSLPTMPKSLPRRSVGAEDDPLGETNEAKEDMKFQGASRSQQLFELSVGIELGWKATPVETVGGQYGSSTDMAAAIKRMSKLTKASSKTFSDLLHDGAISGDVSHVERHIDRCSQKFMADPRDTFYVAAATRLSRAWLKARGLDKGDLRVGCRYLWLLLDDKAGRGLGEVVDVELMRVAEKMIAEVDRAAGGAPIAHPRSSGPPSVASGYTDLSGMAASAASSAATKQMDDLSTAMLAQMKALVEAQQESNKAIARNESKVADLASKVGALRKGGSGAGAAEGANKGECLVCKQPGHRAAQCPLVLAAQKSAAE